MKIRIFSVLMAVWMFLAGAAGAALSVCHAPCCAPNVAAAAHGGTPETPMHECGMNMASSEDEAALFFAEENGGVPQSLSDDSVGHHFENSKGCVALLRLLDEYNTPHAKSVNLDPPAVILLVKAFSCGDPTPKNQYTLDENLNFASGPPGPPVHIALSRFTC